MQFDFQSYPGLGLRPLTLKASAWNRTGGSVAIGDCVMVDQKGTQTEDSQVAATTTLTTNAGADSFPINNVITPTTAGIGAIVATVDPGYWFGIVTGFGTTGTGADNTLVEVTYQGRVKAAITASLSTPSWGIVLTPANGVRTLSVNTIAGNKCVARLEADTTSAGLLSDVLFDGLAGFGVAPFAS